MIMMSQFTVHYNGPDAPQAEIDAIGQMPGVQVLDTLPKTLLVETATPDALVKAIADHFPGWTVAPTKYIGLPTVRPQLKSAPDEKAAADQSTGSALAPSKYIGLPLIKLRMKPAPDEDDKGQSR